jgi:hypothetical protein
LHTQFAYATASLKQDALLFSARLLYTQGNEDEAVQVLEASLELTVAMARVIHWMRAGARPGVDA